MFKPQVNDRSRRELSPAQLEDARLGFNHLLRKHFSPQWVERHAEDLFAKAALEYSRKLDEGVRIERPGAWIVTCAWQRTKSELEAERREPQLVSTEYSGPLATDLDDGPEEATLGTERLRKVQDAIAQLSEDQRRLLDLAYFEDMSVREAGRQLHWHSSKVQRCHNSARKRLHELLGVESLDELEVIVGLAAYLSLSAKRSSSLQPPAGLEALAERSAGGAGRLWLRVQDLARRFTSTGGTDPAGAALGGNIGRAAGVCAAGVACLVGGAIVLGGGHGASPPQTHRATASSHRTVSPRIVKAAPRVVEPQPRQPRTVTHTAVTARPTQSGSARQASRHHEKQAAKAQLGIESVDQPGEETETMTEPAPTAESSAPSATSGGSAPSHPSPSELADDQLAP